MHSAETSGTQTKVERRASARAVMGWPRTLARLAHGRNINPETLLATDYLNHFNEIVMLIDMAADMPECIEDIAAWQPLSYAGHFRRSNFAARELAILAYENAPERHRDPFDVVIAQANRIAQEAAHALSQATAADAPETAAISAIATRYAQTLRRLIDIASGIVNGKGLRVDQSEIDAILAE